MKKLLIFLFVVSFNSFSQDILWKNVDRQDVFPYTIYGLGYIILDNGDKTPVVDLFIDTKNKVIYYKNKLTNNMYNIFVTDFKEISLMAYNSGEILKDYELYGVRSDEILASLRKDLYDKADLNVIEISSTIKEGFLKRITTFKERGDFFSRSQPKFFINENDDLDVYNKEIIKSKLLIITPEYIEFIDEDGDIVQQTNRKKATVEGANDKENKKQDKKTTRILNIKLGNKYYLNIREFYNVFYTEYEKLFYEGLETFKSDFVGQKLSDILREWGPHTEEFVIDDDSKMYVWAFKQKFIEHESSSTGIASKISNIIKTSVSDINASLSSQYGINTEASKMNLGGYGSVMSSYSKINGSSYLNWYSKNVTNQYEYTTTSVSSKTSGTSYEVDVTKKIALIVDKNLLVKEVLEKNYFSEPYYGVRIKFYE